MGDVVKFLRLYDRDAKIGPALLKSTLPQSGPKPAVQKFLEDLSQVRAFFAPLLPPEDAASAPAYDLSVDFRVSRQTEVDGDKIIDWVFQVGDQTIRLGDANRRAKWRPGMPVVLTLRWAKDALSAPAHDNTQKPPARITADKNVIYEYDDAWALVSMLEEHAASSVDLSPLAEQKPHVLKFEFATESATAGGKPTLNVKRAKVFVRIVVSPGGKPDVLKLPVFPVLAPSLDSPTRTGMIDGDAAAR
jgi:type VI secretion system protein ImpL